MNNLLMNLPNSTMAHHYSKCITEGNVYGLFPYPMQPKTVKFLPNYKGLSALHTTFRFCRVGPRVENPTTFIIIEMAMYFVRVGSSQ